MEQLVIKQNKFPKLQNHTFETTISYRIRFLEMQKEHEREWQEKGEKYHMQNSFMSKQYNQHAIRCRRLLSSNQIFAVSCVGSILILSK